MTLFPRKSRTAAAVPTGQRVYAIGDIHGRIDLFDRLLARIEADNRDRGPASVLVLLLGDLIDRGPDSAAVVRRAMQPLDWARLRSLKGNHEAALLAALEGDRGTLDRWLRAGGAAALASWGIAEGALDQAPSAQAAADRIRAAITRDERVWLASCPLSIRIGDYLFVHAGIRPGIAVEAQSEQDMLWIREPFLGSARNHGVTVVHGHTVVDDVDERSNRINIDTGAYLGGRLTALGLEGSARWILQTDGDPGAR